MDKKSAYDQVIPFPIEGATCANCGGALAWCSGVGRLVVRHANGETICAPPTTVALRAEDTDKAHAALEAAEAAYAALVEA